MNTGIRQLAAIVAAHLQEWEPSPPFVELAIFEYAEAYSIAGTLDTFCMRNLGSPIAGGLFHQSSVGSVTGVVLDDGRSVVIKAHQPERSREFLGEVVRVQSYLAERCVFATKVVAGPLPLGRGYAIVEDIPTPVARPMHTVPKFVARSRPACTRSSGPAIRSSKRPRWDRACSQCWVMRYGLRPTASCSISLRAQQARSGLTM
jgi:hypothetical protein